MVDFDAATTTNVSQIDLMTQIAHLANRDMSNQTAVEAQRTLLKKS